MLNKNIFLEYIGGIGSLIYSINPKPILYILSYTTWANSKNLLNNRLLVAGSEWLTHPTKSTI